jgi:hypothetical protein
MAANKSKNLKSESKSAKYIEHLHYYDDTKSEGNCIKNKISKILVTRVALT